MIQQTNISGTKIKQNLGKYKQYIATCCIVLNILCGVWEWQNTKYHTNGENEDFTRNINIFTEFSLLVFLHTSCSNNINSGNN